MTQNNTDKAAQLAVLNRIHSVEGFDPVPLAVDYTDLNTGESRKRLPVMAQMAWFRLAYPEGKIALSVAPADSCFVATARIYPSYKDPVECYLSEATASRSYDPNNPSVSPREWAQTAAVGIALRNAGFGLQFGAAGDSWENSAPDELGPETGYSGTVTQTSGEIGMEEKPVETAEPDRAPAELTPEERYRQALALPCPIAKYKGKTLGDMVTLDPHALNWIANKFSGGAELSEAAKFICEYAAQQAGI